LDNREQTLRCQTIARNLTRFLYRSKNSSEMHSKNMFGISRLSSLTATAQISRDQSSTKLTRSASKFPETDMSLPMLY
jgi:hypothetical protein